MSPSLSVEALPYQRVQPHTHFSLHTGTRDRRLMSVVINRFVSPKKEYVFEK